MQSAIGKGWGCRCAFGGLLLFGVCGGSTLAATSDQQPPDPDLSTREMRRAGPFYIQPLFVLKDVGYDDNIRFEAQTPEGDTTATTGAALGALLLGGDRGGLRLFGEADYVAFGKNADLDHWNGDSRARGILLLKRAILSLEDHFTSVRERPTAEIDERVRRKNNVLTAAFETLHVGRLGARGYVKRESVDYSAGDPSLNDIGQVLNRDENTLGLVGEVRVLPKTTFTLEGNVQRVDFLDPSLGRDNRSTSVLPGFKFDPSASVQGEFKIGTKSFDAPDSPGNRFRGTVGEGHLSTRLGHAARLKATFDRSLVFSILADNLYFVSTSWTAGYEQFFNRRLSGELSFGRGVNHYPQEVTLTTPVPFQGIRDDRITNYQATIRYKINEQLTLNVSGMRLVRDSTDAALDRERNFYTFGTSYAF
jgi:putative beta-barrel porin BBP2